MYLFVSAGGIKILLYRSMSLSYFLKSILVFSSQQVFSLAWSE